jgi:hypothetical protein
MDGIINKVAERLNQSLPAGWCANSTSLFMPQRMNRNRILISELTEGIMIMTLEADVEPTYTECIKLGHEPEFAIECIADGLLARFNEALPGLDEHRNSPGYKEQLTRREQALARAHGIVVRHGISDVDRQIIHAAGQHYLKKTEESKTLGQPKGGI